MDTGALMAAAGPAKTQAADVSVCLNFLTRSQTFILVCGMLALVAAQPHGEQMV